MLSVFKGYRVLYIILCVLYIIGAVIFLNFVDFDLIISMLVWVSVPLFTFTVGLIINLRIKAKMDSYQRILDEQCDPVKYCEIFEKLIKKDKKRNCRFVLDMNYGVGLCDIGSKKAIEVTSALTRDPLFSRLPMLTKLIAYNNLAVYLKHSGNYEEAEKCSDKAIEYINEIKIRNNANAKLLKTLDELLESRRHDLNVMHGDNSHTEEFLKNAIEKADCMRKKVTNNFELALYYRSTENKSGELECMRFVAENGNTMFIANKARKRIEELQ